MKRNLLVMLLLLVAITITGCTPPIAHYEDGSYEIKIGNIRWSGCDKDAICEDSVPATPSVQPDGCSPFEDCHIGEYAPNTHEGAWLPSDI